MTDVYEYGDEGLKLPDRPDHLYRVEGHLNTDTWPDQVGLYVMAFPIVKRTTFGCWIKPAYGKKKFVLNDSKKRYAHPTKREALEALVHRKNRQIAIVRFQLKQARAVRREVEKLLGEGRGADEEERRRRAEDYGFDFPLQSLVSAGGSR